MPDYEIFTDDGGRLTVSTDNMEHTTGGTLVDQWRARLRQLELSGKLPRQGGRVSLKGGPATATVVTVVRS